MDVPYFVTRQKKKRSSAILGDSGEISGRKRVHYSENEDLVVEELFSLPKAVPKKQEKLKVLKVDNKKPENKLKTYIAFKRRREDFRQKLIHLIINKEGESSSPHEIPNAEEREVLKYYYFIRHGIDTIHVAPMESDWWDNIYSLIPDKLKQWKNSLKCLKGEVKNDFVLAVKEAIIHFVLTDSNENDNSYKRIIKFLPKCWKQQNQFYQFLTSPSFTKAFRYINNNLYTVNSCLPRIMELWSKSFCHLRLVDLKEITKIDRSLTLFEFNVLCNKHTEIARDCLNTHWYPLIRNIVEQARKRKLIPDEENPKAMKCFFDCIECLMTYQLQNLCLDSLHDYELFLREVGFSSKGFVIKVDQHNSVITFEPTFNSFKDVLLKIYDSIVVGVEAFPRLENVIDKDCKREGKSLNPIILPNIVEELKKKSSFLLDDQRVGPELSIQDFDAYIDLLNGNAESEVNKFIAGNYTFKDYVAAVLKYHELSVMLPIQVAHVVTLGIYEIHRDDLIKRMVVKAGELECVLLKKMVEDYQHICKQLGEEYEEISKKALMPPKTTSELMEFMKFIHDTEAEVIVEMEGRLRIVMDYLCFLSDYNAFASSEMKQNSITFQWYRRMPEILDESQNIIKEKLKEFQEFLKERVNKFEEDLSLYNKQADEFSSYGEVKDLHKYVKKANHLDKRLNDALGKIDRFNEEEAAFGFKASEYPMYEVVTHKLIPYKKLYDNSSLFLNKYEQWMSSRVGTYNPNDIEDEVSNCYTIICKSEKTFSDLLQPQKLASAIRIKIVEFRKHMPIIQTLGNPGMKERHWEKVSEIVGFPIKPDANLTLEKVIDFGLDEFIAKFETISEAATKENNLEKALTKMQSEWSTIKFTITLYRDTGTYILSAVDDIQLLLDDHIVKTQTMKSSAYIKPFEKEIVEWEQKLMLLQEILDDWLKVQSTWMYLEPIFSSPDIHVQMPEEGRRFSAVDKIWRDIMKSAMTDSHVLVVIQIEKMLERLKKCNSLLDLIQRGLNDYLEIKRLYFPRLFFLSNDELLEILSETKNPTRVQPHLKKCFEGVQELKFTADLVVEGVVSLEGEEVPLTSPISTADAQGQVEKWLKELESTMKESVHHVVKKAMDDFPAQNKESWAMKWPGQAVLSVSQLYWTSEVTNSMKFGVSKMSSYLEIYKDQMNHIISLLNGKLNKRDQITLRALIIMDVHARDVILSLIEKGVNDTDDFQWLCQLRYYWIDENLITKMMSTELKYGYEYLGNTSRIVITPLTERCFRTFFVALSMHLGGAIEGPAATGKTETTKDFTRAIGKQCILFNCSESLNHLALGKFFKGLASCGAWSCFDEFNRINVQVLSMAAQQILTIRQAVLAKMKIIEIDGAEIDLDHTCAIFITLHPRYPGRSELPDNLKAMFRPVAIMVPNYSVISEVLLYASGFSNANVLSTKIVTTHKLCSEQLSSQIHYDFGLRSTKGVLTAADNFKQKNPDMSENLIVLQSLHDVNLPKLVSQDIPLFQDIMRDLFPGVTLPQLDHVSFNQAVNDVCAANNIQCTETVLQKIKQFHKLMLIRHGIMIIGLPFGGKTTLYRTLSATLAKLEEENEMDANKVQVVIMNPKSVTLGQLYGQFDPVSQEWFDGILAVSYRQFAMSSSKDRKWIVLDSPVDSTWIETMNTVLDDNKKLCLTSGEIIKLSSSTNLVFETMDLDAASPATVSRCGMVYMDPVLLGWKPLLVSWLNTFPESINDVNRQVIQAMFERFIPVLMHLIRKCGHKELTPVTDLGLIKGVMNLFDCFMDDFNNPEEMKKLVELDIRAQLEGIFFFSCMWGMAGILDSNGREKFSNVFRGLMSKEFPKELQKTIGYHGTITPPFKPFIFIVPAEGLIFDYKFIKEGKGKWKPWADDLSSAPAIPRDIPVNQIIVTTVETIRHMEVLRMLITHEKPAMFVGPTATGKSAYIADILNHKINAQKYLPHFMYFSVYTNCNLIQDMIMGKLDKRRKGVYGPPLGKKFVFFIDDVNTPLKDEYGTQPPIELLRQWLDHWTWFDRKDNCAIRLMDIQLVCAMGPISAGGNQISPRFLRHFTILGINEFNDEILKAIFSKIMLWHLDTRGFSKEFDPCIGQVVNSTLTMYNSAKLYLLPTPAKPHYFFNLRDFTRVVQGVLLSVPEATEDLMSLKRLWVHEALRVFFDRLIDGDDREKMCNVLHLVVKEHLEENLNDMFSHLFESDEENQIGDTHLSKIIYCDFANPKADTRNYIECTDMSFLTSVCENYLTEYNNMSKKPMNLVLFRYAIEHLSRVCRILKQPRSHGLMLGPCGSGRQSITRLASHMSEYELFQVELTKQYGMIEWHDEIRNVLQTVSNDSHCVLLFSDTQVKDMCFLEDVCNILNYGEIPNIFNADEKAELSEKVRSLDQQRDKALQTDGSAPALYNFFIEVVRNQLHIILCMSPQGKEFQKFVRMFPVIITNCTINWFHTWPEDAFLAVAHHYLSNLDISEKELAACIDVCQNFHTTSQKMSSSYLMHYHKYYYIAPTNYVDLIYIFKELLVKKREDILKDKQCYALGIEKIEGAAGEIHVLQDDLEALKPELEKADAQVQEIQAIVDKETNNVAEREEIVMNDEEEANRQCAITQEIRESCDIRFSEAMPIINDAAAMLHSLSQEDIGMITSMKTPSDGVRLVMEAVCLLKDVKPDQVPDPNMPGKMLDDYWGPSKRILGDVQFIDSLLTFDKDNVPDDVISTLETNFLNDEEFDPENVKSAVPSAEGLCRWVIGIVTYHKIAKEIEPKKDILAEAETKFSEIMSALEEKRALLRDEQDKLGKLQNTLDEQSTRFDQLQANSDLCAKKLQRANDLIAMFGGEKDNWTKSIHDLEHKYICLTGDILVSSGIVAYLGPFTKELREELILLWLKMLSDYDISFSQSYSLISILGDTVLTNMWAINGLPNDTFSIDNGIIMKNSRRFSLMVDPQEQASKWIKNLERTNNLNVIYLSQPDYLRILENAVQFGQPVLMENIGEDIDAILEPLLRKQIFKQGNTNTIKIGESMIEYSEDFRLYITTKLRNPHYPPEIQLNISLINFTIGCAGLEDKLLNIVLAKELPTLVSEKNQLTIQENENRRTLKEMDSKILHALYISEGNILEDETAVNLLNTSKLAANEATEKQKIFCENEKQIDKTIEVYKPVARYATTLFLCIVNLANVDSMYQYSLTWFSSLLSSAIEKMPKIKEISEWIDSLKNQFTYLIYNKICTSIFEKDQLLFSMMLTIHIMKSNDEFNKEEWIFLLTRDSYQENNTSKPITWLSVKSWSYINQLDKLPNFSGICEHVVENSDDWRRIYYCNDPYTIPLPGEWDKKLNGFQRMLVVSCINTDSVIASIQRFVEDKMGKKYITSPPFDLVSSFTDSCSTFPLVFLLTPCSDPTSLLLQFADEQGVNRNRIELLSVGQSQTSSAQRLILEGAKSGNWIVLQNCHLAMNFMSILERICEDFTANNTHPDFRLWMMSYSCTFFPLSILQNSVKISYEQPTSLQANIIRSYLNDPISNSQFFKTCKQSKELKKLLFGFVFFHGVIQERCQFGPIGWNVPYKFNETDLCIGIQELKNLLNDYPKDVKFDALWYLVGDCIYGGHIVDDWDHRTFSTLLRKYCCHEIIEQESYTFDSSGKYHTFEAKDNDEYIAYVKSLPIITNPEVFGMNKNIGIVRQQKEGDHLLKYLLIAQYTRTTSPYGSKLPDETVLEFSDEILQKLPNDYDLNAVMQKYPSQYEQGMNTVLFQEIEQYNILISSIRISLTEVSSAIKGDRVLSFVHDEIIHNIMSGKIPRLWMKSSYPSLKPLGSYIDDLFKRLKFLQTWIDEGTPPVFWISGFYYTQAFLAATLQNFARKNKIPIYDLTFDYKVMSEEMYEESAQDGVFVNGLYLEGACWNRETKQLDELMPRTAFSQMPVIWFIPVETKNLEETSRYLCPVYKTSDRQGVLSTSGHSSNFVVGVLLPTNISSEHWIIRGVGLLCQLSE